MTLPYLMKTFQLEFRSGIARGSHDPVYFAAVTQLTDFCFSYRCLPTTLYDKYNRKNTRQTKQNTST